MTEDMKERRELLRQQMLKLHHEADILRNEIEKIDIVARKDFIDKWLNMCLLRFETISDQEYVHTFMKITRFDGICTPVGIKLRFYNSKFESIDLDANLHELKVSELQGGFEEDPDDQIEAIPVSLFNGAMRKMYTELTDRVTKDAVSDFEEIFKNILYKQNAEQEG